MGQCFSGNGRSSGTRSEKRGAKVPQEKLNRNLHKQAIEGKWTGPELQRQREQFWETAPAYEGQKEIWLALKAAVDAIRPPDSNYDHADTILKCAAVTTLDGTFEKCYDELGTLYKIPNWIVSDPKIISRNKTELKIRPMNFETQTDIILIVDTSQTVKE